MKKNLLALSIAAAALMASTAATAAIDDTFYAGFRGGYAHADWDSSDTAYWDSDDNSGYGLGLFGGYSFNPYFSVEAAYNYFDGFKAIGAANETNDIDVHGPELSLRLSYPLTDAGTDIFLRGGVMYAFADGDSDKLAPVVGAGVNFMLTDNWALRLGYDRYFEVYDEDTSTDGIDFDVDMAYISIGYVFGDRSAPAPVTKTVTQTVTTEYSLDANTTFGFDSDSLSQQGKDAVSQVVLDAQNANLNFAQYAVTGYTDRLGREAYNQKLSERRAQAVADELVAKGVPAGDITVTGMGSANPVSTGCEGLSRNDLIKCLAPDRRVTINVTGTSEVTETVEQPAE